MALCPAESRAEGWSFDRGLRHLHATPKRTFPTFEFAEGRFF
jgi:hypothetical protein